MKLLLSIITPSFNSEKTIEECILSVKNINKEEVEHIIIDGLSRDRTLDVIKKYENSYNVKLISEKDEGIADAMDKGIRMANGEYIGWIDADNYYNTKVFNEIISILKEKSPEILCGYINIVGSEKRIKTHIPPFPFTFKKALSYTTGAIPVQPAVFFKRELFDKIGGFDKTYKVAGDYDFWLRILKLNPNIEYFEKVIGNYRKEDTGASQSLKGIIKGFKEVYSIAQKENQNLYGKIILTLKYTRGYISACKKIFLK